MNCSRALRIGWLCVAKRVCVCLTGCVCVYVCWAVKHGRQLAAPDASHIRKYWRAIYVFFFCKQASQHAHARTFAHTHTQKHSLGGRTQTSLAVSAICWIANNIMGYGAIPYNTKNGADAWSANAYLSNNAYRNCSHVCERVAGSERPQNRPTEPRFPVKMLVRRKIVMQ